MLFAHNLFSVDRFTHGLAGYTDQDSRAGEAEEVVGGVFFHRCYYC